MDMRYSVFIFSSLATILFSIAAQAASTSGLQLPRFVSLKSEETNIRTGPGTRYPIQWVYRRSEVPVEVIEEYDLWRKIRDVEGTTGWVHKSMLDGKRYVMITGKEPRLVRTIPETTAKGVLKAEPMVTARLIECLPEWCQIQISGRKGWVEKTYLWGVYPEEVIE